MASFFFLLSARISSLIWALISLAAPQLNSLVARFEQFADERSLLQIATEGGGGGRRRRLAVPTGARRRPITDGSICRLPANRRTGNRRTSATERENRTRREGQRSFVALRTRETRRVAATRLPVKHYSLCASLRVNFSRAPSSWLIIIKIIIARLIISSAMLVIVVPIALIRVDSPAHLARAANLFLQLLLLVELTRRERAPIVDNTRRVALQFVPTLRAASQLRCRGRAVKCRPSLWGGAAVAASGERAPPDRWGESRFRRRAARDRLRPSLSSS